jgi:hypothetical protein
MVCEKCGGYKHPNDFANVDVCTECANKECAEERQIFRDSEGFRNCPFCNSRPFAPTHIKRNKATTECPNSKCPIFGVVIPVGIWNGAK